MLDSCGQQLVFTERHIALGYVKYTINIIIYYNILYTVYCICKSPTILSVSHIIPTCPLHTTYYIPTVGIPICPLLYIPIL